MCKNCGIRNIGAISIAYVQKLDKFYEKLSKLEIVAECKTIPECLIWDIFQLHYYNN